MHRKKALDARCVPEKDNGDHGVQCYTSTMRAVGGVHCVCSIHTVGECMCCTSSVRAAGGLQHRWSTEHLRMIEYSLLLLKKIYHILVSTYSQVRQKQS